MPILPTLVLVSQVFGGIFAGYRDAGEFGFEPGLLIQGIGGYRTPVAEMLLRVQYGDEPKTLAEEGWTDTADFRLRIHTRPGLFGTVGIETVAWHAGDDEKRATRPTLGLGFDVKTLAIELLYHVTDRTENQLSGWSLEAAGKAAPRIEYQVVLFSGDFRQDEEARQGFSYRLLIGYMFKNRPEPLRRR